MCARRKIHRLMGVMLLVPGMVAANGTQPIGPSAQTAQAPVAPMWPQPISVPNVQPYYQASQLGLAWPMPPQYPAHTMAMFVPWMPFVWVWVPVLASVPAEVDYGPVADTPVIELSLADAAEDIAMASGGAAHAPATVEADTSAKAGGATLDVSSQSATSADDSLSAGDKPESGAVPAMAPMSAVAVDYGPVMPTPVVDMLVLEKQLAEARVRKPARRTSRTVLKPAVAPLDKPDSTKTDKPVKKRMCWSKGVVAPCR